MQNIFKVSLLSLIIGFMFLSPMIGSAQLVDESTRTTQKSKAFGGLVPCGTDKKVSIDPVTKEERFEGIKTPCDFKYFLYMINKIVKFIFIVLTVPIAAISFAYAGFLLLFSGGEQSKRTQAKNIFLNTAKGLILIAACWLIIDTILSVLGYDGAWIGF